MGDLGVGGHVSCLDDVSGDGNGEYEKGRDNLQEVTSFKGAGIVGKRM